MAALEGWASKLVDECRDALSVVLPLSESEREFLDRLLDHGEIQPTLLGIDQWLSERNGFNSISLY